MSQKKQKRAKQLRRKLRDKAVVSFLRLVAAAVPRLRLETVQRLAKWAGAVAARIPGSRRQRVERHLQIAFPEGSPAEREHILRRSFEGTTQLFLEAVWMPAWKSPRDDWRVRMMNQDNWDRMLALTRERGRGLVALTAHLGTVELLAPWFCSKVGMPVLVVAAKPKMEGLEELARRQREAGGYRVVWRGDAGMAAMRHLRAGGALVMLVDHNLRGPGVAVPFFGTDAHTLLAPARLALQSGATANTILCLRDGVGKVLVYCGEPIVPPAYPADKQERFVREAEFTREYTRRIEEMVRQYPEQYLWMHKRWQSRLETLPYPS